MIQMFTDLQNIEDKDAITNVYHLQNIGDKDAI